MGIFESRGFCMQEMKYITIISNREKIVLGINSILYLIVTGKKIKIHVSGDKVYETRMSLNQLENELGDDFIKIHKGCLVSAKAIHDITDSINLINGDSLQYTIRKKSKIIEELHLKQKNIINRFNNSGIPETEEDFFNYFRSFDNMPFAFTDIEMIFDDEKHAVDWIFRYGNEALSKLERVPLNELIGKSFRSIFRNMDSKWLKSYERTALYNEFIELIDFSPEINIYLKVICFPTFKGHCGCILFNIDDIKFTKSSDEAVLALKLYLNKNLH